MAPRYGGMLKIIFIIERSAVLRQIPGHLGLPTGAASPPVEPRGAGKVEATHRRVTTVATLLMRRDACQILKVWLAERRYPQSMRGSERNAHLRRGQPPEEEVPEEPSPPFDGQAAQNQRRGPVDGGEPEAMPNRVVRCVAPGRFRPDDHPPDLQWPSGRVQTDFQSCPWSHNPGETEQEPPAAEIPRAPAEGFPGRTLGPTRHGEVEGQPVARSPLRRQGAEDLPEGFPLLRDKVGKGHPVTDTALFRRQLLAPDHSPHHLDAALVRLQTNLQGDLGLHGLRDLAPGAPGAHVGVPTDARASAC